MDKRIIYAAPSYASLRRENGYFVDKTEFIAKLEKIQNPIFLRPRRFGKSFMCSLLHYYYDLRFKDDFEELFGDTWIGQNLTGNQSKYIILHLNFSSVASGPTLADIEASFKKKINRSIELLRVQYAPLLDALPSMDLQASVADNLATLVMYTEAMGWPQLFVIIDEYDNFANQLIIGRETMLYRQLTNDSSFLKLFFKMLKEGRENGAIKNVYITGILPVTMDDLASAFNIGTYLTLDPSFETMIGFTQNEVDLLLADILENHEIPANIHDEVNELIKANYDGYHFVKLPADESSTPIYNTTILMYFLRHLVQHKEIPLHLTDANLKTDVGWYKLLYRTNRELATEFMEQLMTSEQIRYDNLLVTNQFNVTQFFDKRFFPTALFYLGLLTRQDSIHLTFPNLNMHQIFVEYFNEVYHLDTINPYDEAIASFLHQPDLEALFRCYWKEYILKLPEAIFSQVNENFYRTTFYEVCMRNFHQWFTWNVERSYPKGKSDLEFVGKHNEMFAGLRWVIEFKYYSKRKMREESVDLANFKLKADDTKQIRGYVEGLTEEYPEAQITQFVIYCFANKGFRLFQVDS